MKPRLQRFTITLEMELLRWVRGEAANRGISVSRLVADFMEERVIELRKYWVAKRCALARKPFLSTDGRYMTRNQAHDRNHLN